MSSELTPFAFTEDLTATSNESGAETRTTVLFAKDRDEDGDPSINVSFMSADGRRVNMHMAVDVDGNESRYSFEQCEMIRDARFAELYRQHQKGGVVDKGVMAVLDYAFSVVDDLEGNADSG